MKPNFFSHVSRHTTWYGFYRDYKFVVCHVVITKLEEGSAELLFKNCNGETIARDVWNSATVAYSRFVKRLGLDNVTCANFKPSRIPSYTYPKGTVQKWGW